MEGLQIPTTDNKPDDRPARAPRADADRRPAAPSRPMVFGMSKSTTAILAIVMALIFTLQVLALSQGQGQTEGARWLTVAIAAGSGVLALLYFVVSIGGRRRDDA